MRARARRKPKPGEWLGFAETFDVDGTKWANRRLPIVQRLDERKARAGSLKVRVAEVLKGRVSYFDSFEAAVLRVDRHACLADAIRTHMMRGWGFDVLACEVQAHIKEERGLRVIDGGKQ